MCLRVYRFNESLALATCLLVLACLPTAGSASPVQADSVQFCEVFDYEQWLRDNPAPGRKRAADLNVGPPRTVRMIYFHPNDRPYRQEVVDSMKTLIRRVQTFCTEQMQAHGYGKKTFRFETDAQGAPLVHRVGGQHPDGHYLDETHVVYDEIQQLFDLYENVYLVVVDHSIDAIGLSGGGRSAGTGGGYKKSGRALVPSSVVSSTVAHELGHAFGLPHDFREKTYIMSYGGKGRNALSACAAQFLAVHPYFNDESSLNSDRAPGPSIEHISARTYAAGAMDVPIELKVNDSYGLHQAILLAVTRDISITAGGSEIKACRGLSGERNAVVEFEYDGSIPSSNVSDLSDPVAHPIRIKVVNTEGDVGYAGFLLSEISPHQIAVLEDHSSQVNSVIFSPSGAFLASGSSDRSIRVWHLETRRPIANLKGH